MFACFVLCLTGALALPNVMQKDDYFENCLQKILSVEFSNDVIFFYGASRFTYKNLSTENSVIITNARRNVNPDSRASSEWVLKLQTISYNEKISTIFFINGPEDSAILMRMLRTTRFYKRKFLIFFKEGVEIARILSIAGNNGVFHVAFGVFTANGIEFYSWFPFDTNNKCGVNFNVEKINICSETYARSELYRERLYNLQDCILRTSYVKAEPFVVDARLDYNPGLLISLFNAIHKATGVRIEYTREELHEKEYLNEGTLDGLLEHLMQDKSDVILGRLFMNSTSEYTEPGPQIYTEDIVWIAPKPKSSMIYRNILKVFTLRTWIVYANSFIVITIVLILILRLYPTLKVSNCIVLMDIFRLSISGPAHFIPKKTTLRILFTFYTLYCIIMDAIYVSKLSSISTRPKTSIKISNLEIFYINGLFVNLTRQMEKITQFCDSFTNDEIAENTYILNQTDLELLRRVVEVQENGTVIFKSIVDTYTSMAAAVDTFVIKPHSLFLCYYVRKSNVLNEPINYWTLEILEKGLMAKWWDDLIQQRRNYTILRWAQEAPENEVVVLNLVHYEEAFIILVGGGVLSFFVFVLEFVCIRIDGKVGDMKEFSKF